MPLKVSFEILISKSVSKSANNLSVNELVVEMKQKRSAVVKSSSIGTKGTNGYNVCHESYETNHSKTFAKPVVNGFHAMNKSVNGSTHAFNGINGHNSVTTPHNHSSARNRSQSTPKSVPPTTTTTTTPTAKQLIETKNASKMPSNESNNSFVTNTRQTPHSYPKTSQLSSLLSSAAHQWSHSNTSGDPLSQSHVRYAGSRFTEAPNPSLLPKPPKHWMSANAINTLVANDSAVNAMTNGFGVEHNTTDDNIIALRLLQISRDMNATQANSIALNGHQYDRRSYVNN